MVAVLAAVSLLTLATVLEGLAVRGFGMPADRARLVEAVITLLGFAVLFYSVIAARVGRRKHAVTDVDNPGG
jgi:phage shock protein PspC (stress-responsive transcriptional regulator)